MTDMVAKAILSADADGFVGTVNAAANSMDAVGDKASQASAPVKALSNSLDQVESSAARVGPSSRAAASGVEALAQAERSATTQSGQLAAAANNLGNANANLNRSNNATRAGMQQLGFQFSDVAAQMATGTSAAVIFAQQSGQVIQAIQLMGGSMDGTKSKFGSFIGFLGGPWGIGISVAVSVVGMLVNSLGEAEAASNKLELASSGLADAQSVLGQAFDLTTGKLKSQNEMIWLNIEAIEMQLRVTALAKKDAFAATRNNAGSRSWSGAFDESVGPFDLVALRYESRNTKASQILTDLETGKISSEEARQQASRLDYTGSAVTELDMMQAILDYKSAEAHTATADQMRIAIDTKTLPASLRSPGPKARVVKPKKIGEKRDNGLTKETAYFGTPLAAGTYRITSGVGKRKAPVKGGSTNHAGVDMAAPEGTAIYATQDGYVEKSGTLGGYGEAIYIDHGAGTQTRYGHMSKRVAQEGQFVNKGDVIGYVGSTGKSSGNHLHYEMRQNGKVVKNPLNTNAPVDSMGSEDKASDAAERQAKEDADRLKQLQAYGKRAAEAIGGINDRYKEQPRLIAEAASVTQELDDIIAELAERKPPGFEKMIADAQRLKTEVPTIILDAPFKALREETEFARQQQTLILQGRYEEARALEIVRSLEADVGELSEERRAEVVAMVEHEEKINDLLNKREAILSIYVDAIGQLRSSLEELLSGGNVGNFLKQGKSAIDQLRGRLLTERLFGDSLNALDKMVNKRTTLDGEVEAFKFETLRVTDGTAELAGKIKTGGDLIYDAMKQVAGKFTAESGGRLTAAMERNQFTKVFGSVKEEQRALLPKLMDAFVNRPIVVMGAKPEPMQDMHHLPALGKGNAADIKSMSVKEYADAQAKAITEPLATELDRIFGTSFFSRIEGAFTGALSGFYRADVPGAALGGAQGLVGILGENGILGKDLAKVISGKLGTALDGAELGGQVVDLDRMLGLSNALGLKSSKTGGQIGGAIGSFIPIPGGEIIGSIIGSLTGGLFKKTKYGTATLSSDNDNFAVAGNKTATRDAAQGLGGSVLQGLASIAEAFGGEIGSFSTSIGTYKDAFRVSTSGRSGKLKGKYGDVKDFGDDADAAIRFAILDAIADGGVKGLSAKIQKALQSSTDLEKGIQEALKVRQIEDIVGGLVATLNRQFQEFERQAAERVRIAREYGFDVAEIEKYNAEQRAKLVEDILADRVGALQDFLKDMRTGDLSEGSPDEKRAALLAEIAKVQADARAGKDGAADTLANLSRELVQLSRSSYGTAGAEYAADRTQAISAAEEIIRIENERIAAAQKAQIDTAAAVQASNVLLDEGNGLLAQLGTDIAAIRAAMTSTSNGSDAAFDLSQWSRETSL